MSDTLRPSLIRYDMTPPEEERDMSTSLELPTELFVQRVDIDTPEEVVDSLAPSIQEVLQAGYTRSFENTGILPRGTVTQELFDPRDPDKVDIQRQRLQTYTAAGSQYFLTWTADPRQEAIGQPVGVAKISPSFQKGIGRMVFSGDENPNLFLNDICTAFGRRGIGAITLAAALEFGGFDPSKKLALHTFSQLYEQNKWYKNMGLAPERTLRKPFVVGSHSLQQGLWVSERGLTIKSALDYLNFKHPDTRTATILNPLPLEFHKERAQKYNRAEPRSGLPDRAGTAGKAGGQTRRRRRHREGGREQRG